MRKRNLGQGSEQRAISLTFLHHSSSLKEVKEGTQERNLETVLKRTLWESTAYRPSQPALLEPPGPLPRHGAACSGWSSSTSIISQEMFYRLADKALRSTDLPIGKPYGCIFLVKIPSSQICTDSRQVYKNHPAPLLESR